MLMLKPRVEHGDKLCPVQMSCVGLQFIIGNAEAQRFVVMLAQISYSPVIKRHKGHIPSPETTAMEHSTMHQPV